MASIDSDAQLVARCRQGEAAAWRELVERFSRYVYAIAVQGYRLSPTDAEDVFQDVFARVYERLDQLREDGAIRPWIGQLTRRRCVDRLREGHGLELAEQEERGETDERLAGIDQALGLLELMRELPEHCQEILDRFFTRDESYRTIGEALDLPPGTIASRISRCLTRLREILGEEKGSPPGLVER